jgi:hypothetical protein
MTAAGGFLQTTLRHTYSNRSGISLIVSIDTYRRNDVLREARNTVEVHVLAPVGLRACLHPWVDIVSQDYDIRRFVR